MKLHENQELFRDAVIATAQQKGIREIYVEKDYWVTYALFHIFKSEISRYSGDMHPAIPAICTHLLNYHFDKDIFFFLYSHLSYVKLSIRKEIHTG